MHKWKSLVVLVLLAAVLAGCSTLPDPSKFLSKAPDIKKVALLPLFVNINVRNLSLGNEEVKGFSEYWNLVFISEFKKITFINGIQILYPGEDYQVTPEMTLNPDFGKIAQEIKADAVMGFELYAYNEVAPGEAVAMGCLTFGRVSENMIASFKHHNYYLHEDDWLVNLHIQLGGLLPSIEEQRTQFVNRVIDWIDKNHPLSINYKK
jgi:hypothetical protein